MTGMQKIGAAVALLAALVVAAVLAADAVVRSAMESSLTRVMGTETTVESLDLGLLSGRTTFRGLRVANPEGFEDGAFLTLRSGRLEAGLPDLLLADTVGVRELVLEGLALDLVQRGTRGNFVPVLASLREARARGGETAYRVSDLVLRDVTGQIDVRAGPVAAAEAAVEIPEIHLEDVGSGSGGAVVLAELAERTLRAVLRAVARRSDAVPGPLRRLLLERIGGDGAGGLQGTVEQRLREVIPGGDDDG